MVVKSSLDARRTRLDFRVDEAIDNELVRSVAFSSQRTRGSRVVAPSDITLDCHALCQHS